MTQEAHRFSVGAMLKRRPPNLLIAVALLLVADLVFISCQSLQRSPQAGPLPPATTHPIGDRQQGGPHEQSRQFASQQQRNERERIELRPSNRETAATGLRIQPATTTFKQPQRPRPSPNEAPEVYFQQQSLENLMAIRPERKTKDLLEFMHIAKTGGSFVECAASFANITWGSCHFVSLEDLRCGLGCSDPTLAHSSWSQGKDAINAYTRSLLGRHEYHYPNNIPRYDELRKQLNRGSRGNAFTLNWHAPHHWYRPSRLSNHADTFTVVRNPYTRMLSNYYCRYEGHRLGHGSLPNDPRKNNATLLEEWTLRKLGGVQMTSHYIPQHYFVYDLGIGDLAKAMDSQNYDALEQTRKVNHVLTFESPNKDRDIRALLELYGLQNVPITRDTAPMGMSINSSLMPKPMQLKVGDMTPATIEAINRFYYGDFLAFGYEMLQNTETKPI